MMFDPSFQTLQTQRVARLGGGRGHVLWEHVWEQLQDRLVDVKRDFPVRVLWEDQTTVKADLILSCLSLQHAQDIGGELARIYDRLNEGGLFLAALMGQGSLHELRDCLTEAESGLRGGAAARFTPLPAPEDLGRALTATGFALPVVDHLPLQMAYDSATDLMHDLRALGCTNALTGRPRNFAPQKLFEETERLYRARYPTEENDGIVASFTVIFLHGWRENTYV